MEGRPPEVVDFVTGETLKLACMACIRGHRTKQCGGQACRDKVLWTIKRPGRPSNSCMCKFSGTGRCKCVLAKAQCPHKPKKGEKRAVDCRCDERGRLCCTLNHEQWQAISAGQKPPVRLYRNQEESQAPLASVLLPSYSGTDPAQSPFSTPQTPAVSMGGFTNGSGRDTPQTPMSGMHQPAGHTRTPSLPQSPAGPPRARFGMMGIGAPMGGEGHVGADVLSWQGQAPIAPTPPQVHPTPSMYSQPHTQTAPPFATPIDPSLAAAPYSFANSISQPPVFSPHYQPAHPASHPPTPLYHPLQPQSPGHTIYPAVPPVTASLSELSMAPNGTLPASSAFDIDYFNFQFPGAICQQCGMADCTCRACPTVLQSTMDGSWQQCCSRKHVHAGPAAVVPSAAKSCCGSKAKPESMTNVQSSTATPATTGEDRSTGGCCGGSSSQQVFVDDPFDFNIPSQANGQIPSSATGLDPAATQPHIPSFTESDTHAAFLFDAGAPPQHTHPPAATHAASIGELDLSVAQPSHQATAGFGHDPSTAWQDQNDMDMDFDEFLQEAGCGCGADCPCGMDGNVDMDVDFDLEVSSPADTASPAAPVGKGCCGGGGEG